MVVAREAVSEKQNNGCIEDLYRIVWTVKYVVHKGTDPSCWNDSQTRGGRRGMVLTR